MKVIILKGVPASGKSTWARKFVKGKGAEWIIVNRDSIRIMFGDYFISKREKLVKCAAEMIINIGLSNNFNVIIDETNLKSSRVEALRRIILSINPNIEIEVKEFKVKKRTAIRRDLIRRLKGGHYVGWKVINEFYKTQEEES